VLLASGEFTLQDWMRLPLEADLVTLSACQTGISDVGRGDDLTGLTRALLYAGASSALVTLWSVRADTTQAWMQDFYGRVWDAQGAKRVDEATAFRQATLALRERHPDPYVWAPFALVGDWR
jgi:CHAT domain-containing protein